jgi:hypothetical protein
MNGRKLALLEKAFMAEIDAALNAGIWIMQSRSKLAKELVDSGHLIPAEMNTAGRFPIKVTGYALTHLGRLEYCVSCKDEIE